MWGFFASNLLFYMKNIQRLFLVFVLWILWKEDLCELYSERRCGGGSTSPSDGTRFDALWNMIFQLISWKLVLKYKKNLHPAAAPDELSCEDRLRVLYEASHYMHPAKTVHRKGKNKATRDKKESSFLYSKCMDVVRDDGAVRHSYIQRAPALYFPLKKKQATYKRKKKKSSFHHCCQLTIIVYIRFLNLIITMNSLPYSNPHTSILSRSMFTHRFLLI